MRNNSIYRISFYPPYNKIAKTLDDDIRAILQSFTANALFKILVG